MRMSQGIETHGWSRSQEDASSCARLSLGALQISCERALLLKLCGCLMCLRLVFASIGHHDSCSTCDESVCGKLRYMNEERQGRHVLFRQSIR